MALNILITGGFGFIGGRVSIYLGELGQNIIIGTRKISSTTSFKKFNKKRLYGMILLLLNNFAKELML